ncbi:hypothetical protein FRB95_004253, partial [Tulasnella sp. JGI-2019a]
ASGDDITEFVQRLQSAVFTRGLQPHDDWTASYASTLMSGEALIWWNFLDVEVQTNWSRLRTALLAQFSVIRMTVPAPQPAATVPPPQAGIKNGSTQAETVKHITMTSIAIAVWTDSERHSAQGIRIYRPESGDIQEIHNKHYCGQLDWEGGRKLIDPVGVSDIAPLAAADSFGSGI